jgi:hypothetical protein
MNSVSHRLVYQAACSSWNNYLVKCFAQEVIGPKVQEMDENEMIDPSIIKGLFEQGMHNPLPSFLLYLAHIYHSL